MAKEAGDLLATCRHCGREIYQKQRVPSLAGTWFHEGAWMPCGGAIGGLPIAEPTSFSPTDIEPEPSGVGEEGAVRPRFIIKTQPALGISYVYDTVLDRIFDVPSPDAEWIAQVCALMNGQQLPNVTPTIDEDYAEMVKGLVADLNEARELLDSQDAALHESSANHKRLRAALEAKDHELRAMHDELNHWKRMRATDPSFPYMSQGRPSSFGPGNSYMSEASFIAFTERYNKPGK